MSNHVVHLSHTFLDFHKCGKEKDISLIFLCILPDKLIVFLFECSDSCYTSDGNGNDSEECDLKLNPFREKGFVENNSANFSISLRLTNFPQIIF